MSFVFEGYDYEGNYLWNIIPNSGTATSKPPIFLALCQFIEGGGKACLELTDGAREGTIGELVLTPEMMEEMYILDFDQRGNKYWMRNPKHRIERMKFDDRKNIINIEHLFPRLRFGVEKTVWSYTIKKRDPVEKEVPPLFDHFGTEVKIDSIVMFMHGGNNDYELRMGRVDRISPKYTVWVEAFRTRKDHEKKMVKSNVTGTNMFVLDGDLREKAMLAKLAL